MSRKLTICIVTPGYPGKQRSDFSFVAQLAAQLADMKHKVIVISAQSINKSWFRKIPLEPKHSYHYTENNNKIEVYRPITISTGNLNIFNYRLSLLFVKHAINKCVKNNNIKADVFYGHFWHSAYTVYEIARNQKTPLFVASGESTITICKMIPCSKLQNFFSYVSGVICVSSKNKDESIHLGLTNQEKCIVLPNGVDSSKFYKKNRSQVRSDLGYDENDFIIAFTGGFIERKGVLRLSEAISQLKDEAIKSVFIGSGQQKPKCNGILYCGTLPHNEIVNYLNCADAFVLPTLQEGSSNAIIEAMACGLPIISSNRSFNDEILNNDYAIRIDPLDINQIAMAIIRIKNNVQLKNKMAQKALEASKLFTIQERAAKIILFINKNIKDVRFVNMQ